MKHVLPIKSSYVSSWGAWECVRELLQNAKDAEQEHGHTMSVEYIDGTLRIANEGADMRVSALLLGESSKAGKGLRGVHGEGLDLALLCAARSGYDLQVLTRTERWTPRIEHVDQYGERCLVVETETLEARRAGVLITLNIDAATWDELRQRFLFLDPPTDAITSTNGTLILDPNRRGHIFVKGLYVMTSHEFGFGFDLHNVTLDRDRRVIAGFDLQWACATMVRDAMASAPERAIGAVMGALERSSGDVAFLGNILDCDVGGGRKAIAAAFTAKHGPGSVPVSSIAESQKLDRLGLRGVVVNESTAKAIGSELGSAAELAAQERMKPQRTYSWHEMEPDERLNVEFVTARLAEVVDAVIVDRCKLQIVDFADPLIMGCCSLENGAVYVSRSVVGKRYDLLETVVHEVAHSTTSAGDGSSAHTATIESLWSKLYERACGSKAQRKFEEGEAAE